MLTRPILALSALALTAALVLEGCGSDARAADTCKTVEYARCERIGCPTFGNTSVTVLSCQRFYDVQCGRGVQELVKDPTKAELDSCLKAIKAATCEQVVDPAAKIPECSWLVSNTPPPAVFPDAGAPAADTGVAASNDGG